MIDPTQPLEWEDGTPVPSYEFIPPEAFERNGSVLIRDGCDWSQNRPDGYYNISDGGYGGSEDVYQHVRNVGPTGPEPYEEWFR